MLALGEGVTTGALLTVVGALLAAAWLLTSREGVGAIRRGAGRR
jgi:hypothetical protein